MSKTSFIISEKSYLLRKGMCSLIEKIPNTKIIQQIETKDELKSLDEEADFIILNPGLLDASLQKKIEKKTSGSQLISLSDKPFSLSKEIEWAEHIYLDDSQTVILKKLKVLIGNRESSKLKADTPEEISKREADIVKNIALGYSNKEIAEKLFISVHTVVTHRKNITRKLGIKTVPGLTIYAILNKLIDINDTV